MQNEQLQNNEELEPVSGLLRELKRVEAPANFDLGVRGRIAAGRPAEKRGFRIPVLVGYAVPLALLLAVGGYFSLNSYYSAKDAKVPAVAETKTNVAPQLTSPADNIIVTPPAETPDRQIAATKQNTVTTSVQTGVRKTPAVRDKNSGGGSFEAASGIPRRIIQRTDHSGQIQAKDVLTLLGARGSFGENGWKVDAPTANSLAERAGVRAGDVIEAINDQAVNEKASFKSRSSIKSLRVRRDGKSLDIVLKN